MILRHENWDCIAEEMLSYDEKLHLLDPLENWVYTPTKIESRTGNTQR
jgi:hypothetical protein